MNSEKVETWQGIIISPTYHVLKSWEGYGKNWMHFMYKLNHLFRCIRVSDENSSTLQWLKLGMVSTFHPHSMCTKDERVTAKTRCTSCTNWTISFEVRGFRTKTNLLQRHFIFLNLFEFQTFCAFNMHHSKRHPKISTISNFIFYFSSIYWFVLS